MTSGRDSLRDWIVEMQLDVEQEGALSILGLVHFNASGQAVPVHAVSSKSPGKWGNAEALADLFHSVAERHAEGCVGGGAQQFSMQACFGTSGKPTRTLPFSRMGLAHHGAVPGGGLGTEPPTATGAMSQSMRLLEIHAQGNFALTASLAQTMTSMLDKVTNRLDAVEKRSDERGAALMNVLTEFHKQMQSAQLRMLLVDGARRALPLLPALVGTTTGLDLPQGMMEESFFDSMVETYSPQELQAYVAKMKAPANGVAADLLVKARRRKAARAAEKGREVSYEQAASDAAGDAWDALRGKSKPNGATATNGAHASPPPNGAKANGTSASPPQESGAEVLRDLFAAFGPQAESMLGLVEAQHPELAARIRQSIAPKGPT